MRHRAATLAAVVAAATIGAGGAAAKPAPRSFAGQCDLAGPITPMPGITVIPRPGSRFSFHGSGKCQPASGAARPATLDFRDVATVFDTCELGPDFDLHGILEIAGGRGRPLRLPITLDLARLALAGPFELRAARGGLAVGVAQFAPSGDPQQALMQCAGANGGLTAASLSATFRTLSPLIEGRRSGRPG